MLKYLEGKAEQVWGNCPLPNHRTARLPCFLSVMHPENFEHEQNIPASHKNVPSVWNAHRIQSEFLKCNSIIKEYTTNFQSDGNLAHSGTSMTGVLI